MSSLRREFNVVEIRLSNGKIALCDDSDHAELLQYNWHEHSGGYAMRHGKNLTGRKRSYYMHRDILGLKKDEECDHINGDKLDNRRSNLRKATRSEQLVNGRPSRLNRSCSWRGVYLRKSGRYQKKWRVRLVKNGQTYYGGSFATSRMSALAYNELAIKHFGPQFRFFNQVFSSVKE